MIIQVVCRDLISFGQIAHHGNVNMSLPIVGMNINDHMIGFESSDIEDSIIAMRVFWQRPEVTSVKFKKRE